MLNNVIFFHTNYNAIELLFTCKAWLRAVTSALDSRSSDRVWAKKWDDSESLVSISTLSLSYSLVFFTRVSWIRCSCSSLTCLNCFMHSFKAPSKCATRSSVANFCASATSSWVFSATASASAFSQPENASGSFFIVIENFKQLWKSRKMGTEDSLRHYFQMPNED